MRLARRGALDLAAVSRLPLRECAAAANIPMAGASELVTLAQRTRTLSLTLTLALTLTLTLSLALTLAALTTLTR